MQGMLGVNLFGADMPSPSQVAESPTVVADLANKSSKKERKVLHHASTEKMYDQLKSVSSFMGLENMSR